MALNPHSLVLGLTKGQVVFIVSRVIANGSCFGQWYWVVLPCCVVSFLCYVVSLLCCVVSLKTALCCTSPWPHSYLSSVSILCYFIDPTTIPISSCIFEVLIILANYLIWDHHALPDCNRSLWINKGLKFVVVNFQTTYFQGMFLPVFSIPTDSKAIGMKP